MEWACEKENNCKLNLLDIAFHRNIKFETSAFRKVSII